MERNYGNYSRCILVGLACLLATVTVAQDTLPSFSAVRKPGNKVLVSWTNPYGTRIRQLSIQRSRDSLRQFKSIISLPDPTVLLNGYVDTKSPDTLQFYRIYILLDSGRYVFSPAKKPVKYVPPPPVAKAEKPKTPPPGYKPPRPVLTDEELKAEAAKKNPTSQPAQNKPEPGARKEQVQEKLNQSQQEKEKTTPPATGNKVPETAPPVLPPVENKPAPALPPPALPEKTYQVKRGDTLKSPILESALKRFRDSITLKTKDTLVSVVNDTLIIRPFVAKEVFKTSKYVFTDKSGLLHIELPDATRKAYKVRFYEENKTFLFEVKNIRDQVLLLDKANFGHAGWFLFELYEDGDLKEKNRFFIGRDF